MAPLKITELDHIVLNVRDIHRSLKFYSQVLGLTGERVEEFHAGKVGFPSVRINDRTIIDLFPIDLFPIEEITHKRTGEKTDGNLNHFCLVVEPGDFTGVVDYLKDNQ